MDNFTAIVKAEWPEDALIVPDGYMAYADENGSCDYWFDSLLGGM